MDNEYDLKSFKNKSDAENLLKKSRNSIDEIDNELFNLIYQRTLFAVDIALAKDYLGMPIYDRGREDAIHAKIKKLSEENGIDSEIAGQIVNMLTTLSKNEQNKLLRRNVDG